MCKEIIKEACCVFIRNTAGEILLQHRDNKASYFKGTWGPIGGAVKKGETAEECIVRECYEETGLEITAPILLFIVEEHCKEYVYYKNVDNHVIISCHEGIEMKFIPLKMISCYKISDYHKKIFSKFLNTLNAKGN